MWFVQLFRGLRLTWDGQALSVMQSRVSSLLAYLIIHHQSACTRDFLIGTCHQRHLQGSPYYQCVEDHFEVFDAVYDDRFERQYGFFRPYVKQVIYRSRLWNFKKRFCQCAIR